MIGTSVMKDFKGVLKLFFKLLVQSTFHSTIKTINVRPKLMLVLIPIQQTYTSNGMYVSPLNANPTKWSDILKQFIDYCLWGWRLKRFREASLLHEKCFKYEDKKNANKMI